MEELAGELTEGLSASMREVGIPAKQAGVMVSVTWGPGGGGGGPVGEGPVLGMPFAAAWKAKKAGFLVLFLRRRPYPCTSDAGASSNSYHQDTFKDGEILAAIVDFSQVSGRHLFAC